MTDSPATRKIRVHTIGGPYFDILIPDTLSKWAFGVRGLGYIQAGESIYIPHSSIAAMIDITDMPLAQSSTVGNLPFPTSPGGNA